MPTTTPRHRRELPAGFELDWNRDAWNVGHVFRWAEAFGGWHQLGTITVKPNQAIPEALAAHDIAPHIDIEVFFTE